MLQDEMVRDEFISSLSRDAEIGHVQEEQVEEIAAYGDDCEDMMIEDAASMEKSKDMVDGPWNPEQLIFFEPKEEQALNIGGVTKEILSEVEALSRVNHPNLVHLMGFCSYLRQFLLVYEYVPNGSLFRQLVGLKDADTSMLDWKTCLQSALELVEALAYLHSEGPIYHGNVISNSILLDYSTNAKLFDYWLSCFGSRKPDSNLASKRVQFSRKWPWENIGVRHKSLDTSAIAS
ncbi:hypothetical protein L7F22_030963 [Adiantum nelumboides]|nr:hypothetical protein [Adiantum nelumboides]